MHYPTSSRRICICPGNLKPFWIFHQILLIISFKLSIDDLLPYSEEKALGCFALLGYVRSKQALVEHGKYIFVIVYAGKIKTESVQRIRETQIKGQIDGQINREIEREREMEEEKRGGRGLGGMYQLVEKFVKQFLL